MGVTRRATRISRYCSSPEYRHSREWNTLVSKQNKKINYVHLQNGCVIADQTPSFMWGRKMRAIFNGFYHFFVEQTAAFFWRVYLILYFVLVNIEKQTFFSLQTSLRIPYYRHWWSVSDHKTIALYLHLTIVKLVVPIVLRRSAWVFRIRDNDIFVHDTRIL